MSKFTNQPDVLIIDGSQFLYIYNMTQSPVYGASLIDISVVFYTLRKIYDTIIRFQPKEVHVVFDIGRDLKKKMKFEQYKSSRVIKSSIKSKSLDSMLHERLQFSRKLIHHILEKTPIKSYLIPFVEGDTILAFIANERFDKSKIIVSNDKDMFQLIDENTAILTKSPVTKVEELVTHTELDRVWSSVIGRELNLEAIVKATGNKPISYKSIPYYRAWIGDVSDGIPGIKGIGSSVVGALVQYQQYKGIELFDSPDDYLDWLESSINDINSVYPEILKIVGGRRKPNFNNLVKAISDNEVIETWLTFFKLMDFDFALSELTASVFTTIHETINSEQQYNETEFLELLSEYDLNSTSDYLKWHVVNKILDNKGNWSLLADGYKGATLTSIEALFTKLYHRSVVSNEDE